MVEKPNIFEMLPNDVLLHILNKCDLKSISKFSETSQFNSHAVFSNKILKEKIQKHNACKLKLVSLLSSYEVLLQIGHLPKKEKSALVNPVLTELLVVLKDIKSLNDNNNSLITSEKIQQNSSIKNILFAACRVYLNSSELNSVLNAEAAKEIKNFRLILKKLDFNSMINSRQLKQIDEICSIIQDYLETRDLQPREYNNSSYGFSR